MSISMVEKDAAIAYARAWNTLDTTVILELLDEDARYTSQWVLEELEGKDAISEYLIQKMNAVKDAGVNVYAELGITRSESSDRDCVLMSQGKKDEVQAVVFFEINNNKIQRYDLCMSELLNAKRTGVYPS